MLTPRNLPAVFSKSYCPYCRATKALLSELGAKYYAIELDQVGESSTLDFSVNMRSRALRFPSSSGLYMKWRAADD